jgi:tRNA pseudouridine38/39 synthase
VIELNVVGTAFLWHQIRCIAAVLTMVGEGLEKPDVVQRLLDIEAVNCKPQFLMAEPDPLLLYECSYELLEGTWNRTPSVIEAFHSDVDREVSRLLTRAKVILSSRDRFGGDGRMTGAEASGGCTRCTRHVPLLERKREPSIEERLAKHGVSLHDKVTTL